MYDQPISAAVRELLRRAYAAFNARDIDAVLSMVHPDVAWPNGMEGGYVYGRYSSADGRRRRSVLRDQRQFRGHLTDLRHGPHPARRRRRGERGGVHGERSLYRSPNNHQGSETTYTLSQGSALC